jgi:hypothetical protein
VGIGSGVRGEERRGEEIMKKEEIVKFLTFNHRKMCLFGGFEWHCESFVILKY